MHLGEIYNYPVKSLRGQSHQSWTLDARGLRMDRHYMLINTQGRFTTQRQIHRLALVNTQLTDSNGLILNLDGQDPIHIEHPPQDAARIATTIWKDQAPALHVSPLADQWFSDHFGEPLRLVCIPDDHQRQVDLHYAKPGDQTGFSDGYPILLITDGSLKALSELSGQTLESLRFRPNLVIHGAPAWAEDRWRTIRIGDHHFSVAKPCSRCVIPSINPATGQRGEQPMQALLRHRRGPDKQIYFGQNLIHRPSDIALSVGDPVVLMD